VGVPAYLNGYAALPLVGGLIGQGMAPGAGLAFLVAGGVTSLPAAIAVWALVKPRVFALYIALSLAGAFGAGSPSSSGRRCDPMTTAAPAARRWPVISALGVVMIFTWGSTYYLMTVLAAPIAADTGWSLGSITGALSAGLLVAGLASPRVGRAISRHGGRPVLAAGCATIAAGLLVIAAAPALWVFWAGWLILGLGMAAGLYDPAFASLGRLYGAEARGAITLLTLWGGFASTVCWPLSAFMLDLWGWRGVAAAYAAIHPRRHAAAGPRRDPGGRRRERTAARRPQAKVTLSGPRTTRLRAHGRDACPQRADRREHLDLALRLPSGAGPEPRHGRGARNPDRARHRWARGSSRWRAGGGTIRSGRSPPRRSPSRLGLVLLALDLGVAGAALVLYGGGNGLFSIARGALPLAVFGAHATPTSWAASHAPPFLRRPRTRPWSLADRDPPERRRHSGLIAALAVANAGVPGLLWSAIRRPGIG
jgi:hypothetical protein